MVIGSDRDRRREGDRTDDRPDRGQVILIGAVALAFIVLGVVVVFNGVLYTETLTSAGTGQSASDIETTELEVRQGVACLVDANDSSGFGASLGDEDSPERLVGSDNINDEIEAYATVYQNATANARPVAVTVAPESDIYEADLLGDGTNVTITYDSTDVSYERSLTVTADDCPRSPAVTEFEVSPVNESADRYRVDWAVGSDHSALSKVEVTLVDENDEVVAKNTTEEFDSEHYHDDSDTLEPEIVTTGVDRVRIAVRNEGGYIATETKDV